MNEVLVTPLANGSWVVAMFNRASLPSSLELDVTRLGAGPFALYDVWGKRALGVAPALLRRTVAAHDAELFRLDLSVASLSA